MPSAWTRRPRVLVIRCCRTTRLLEAVRLVRRRFVNADIVVLCHASAAAEVADTGLGDIVTYTSRRLGPFACAEALLRLRRMRRFDAVVIPYMVPDDAGHANVIRTAVALDAPETVILKGQDVEAYDRAGLHRLARRVTLRSLARWLDVPLLLAAVTATSLLPWRRRAAAGGKRRVLHVVTGLGTGGAQVQIGELIARTPLDRYRVDVLVLAPHEGRFSFAAAGWVDVRVRVFDSWPHLTACLMHLYRLCRRERYDIVHTWQFYANIIGVAAARLAGVPRIITSVRSTRLWHRAWYDRPWFRIADVLASRTADVVTVNSPTLIHGHARWALYPARRIHVVPSGLSPDALVPMRHVDRERLHRELNLPEGALVVGTVGRPGPAFDHQTFLRIIARLAPAMPSLCAVIVGDADDERALSALAGQLHIEDRVIVTGPRSDGRFLTAGFDLLLLTPRAQGVPSVLLEAAFLEVPSASTDVGGAGDIIEPHQLFPVGNVSSGARAAAALLGDPMAAHAAAVRARQRALERFTSAKAAADWLDLYERTTGEAA